MKLPSRVKNPRKIKKAWKKRIVEATNKQHGRNRADPNSYWKLHWVPGLGWKMDLFLKRKWKRRDLMRSQSS